MAPPLISEYKHKFVLKRLLETTLGGFKLFSPFPFILIQIILYFILLAVLFLIQLDENTASNIHWNILICCTSIFFTEIKLALSILLLKRRRRQTNPDEEGEDQEDPSRRRREQHVSSILSQEDTVINEGCLKPSTWYYIAPNVNFTFGYLLNAIFSSVSLGLCFPLVMMNSKVIPLYLKIFDIFTLLNARYSCVINSPPEIANFDTSSGSTGSSSSHVLYRISYVYLIGFVCYIAQLCLDPPTSTVIIQVLCSILAFLPIFWGCGILPPVNAIIPWISGTLLMILGGTSPSIHYLGTLVSLIIVVICPILVFVLAQESLQIVMAECLCGYLISCDTGRVVSLNSTLCEEIPTKSFLRQLLHPFLTITISLISVLIAWVNNNYETENNEVGFIFALSLASITISISLISWIFQYFTLSLKDKDLRRGLLLPVHVLHSILPFLLQMWLTLSIEYEKVDWSKVKEDKHYHYSLLRLIPYLLAIRGFALTITEPKKSSIDFCLTFLLRRDFLLGECKTSFVLILFICSIVTGRIKRFCRHWKTFCSILYAFGISTILDSKKISIALITGWCFPISFVSMIVVVLMEGMTLIPLFTLPIFIVGFPRPTTFWGERWIPNRSSMRKKALERSKEVESLDWKIYADIGPQLAKALMRKAHCTKFCMERGNCFLARYEDRLLFIRFLASGWNYAYLQIQGLEMQEQTSCHHQEAAKVDETFDAVLSKQGSLSSLKKMITDILSLLILSPMCNVKLPTYSESKSNISSLASPEERSTFRDMFYRAYSYLWIKNNPALKGETYNQLPPLGKNTTNNRNNLKNNETDKDSSRSSSPTEDLPTDPHVPSNSSNGDFSIRHALYKATKPTIAFVKNAVERRRNSSNNVEVLEEGRSPPDIPNAIGENATEFLAEPQSSSPSPPAEENYPVNISSLQKRRQSILSRQSSNRTPPTNRRFSLTSLPAIPARLVDVEADAYNIIAISSLNGSQNPNGSDRLTTVWIKHCVGDVLPPNAVRARVEKICKSSWESVFGTDEDKDIDLSDFFQESFEKKMKKHGDLSSSRRGQEDTDQLTLTALRYASKLALDEIFSNSSKIIKISPQMEEDIFNQLTIFEREYQFCSPQEISFWIEQSSSKILTMVKKADDNHHSSILRILNYEPEGVEFKVGQLDQYTVEGIWGNLTLELLYLTSDDDERFSIQNDRVLLRNIMTQCAKPPFGYPVYQKIFRVNLHDFNVTEVE